MSTDKHFNEHGEVPKPLDDYRPNDMPAAKTIFIVVLAILILGTAVTALVHKKVERKLFQDPAPTVMVMDVEAQASATSPITFTT